MPNENTAETQGAETQPAENNSTEGQQTTGTQAEPKSEETTTTNKTFTQEDINRFLAKEKREWEKKVKDAEEKAKLSEDERTKSELAQAKAEIAERDRRDAVKEAAEQAGIKNPKLFYNAYKDDLETDAKTGKLANLQEIIEQAKTEAPELFADKNSRSNGSADGGQGKDTKPGYTRDQIERMSPAEIEANWEGVSRFLASQK